MADAAATGLTGKVPPTRDDSCRERRRARVIPIAELPRQLATGELLEHVAAVPSREGMRPPRSDLADNLARFYQALWRHARARGSGRYRLTWGQMLAAAGYEEKGYLHPETPIRRYARLLEEAGLVTVSGRDELADGRTCVVTLHDPPAAPGGLESGERRRSSAGQATSCRAVRRRETRSQRANRRVRPWCPKGGRGRAVERWSFSWGEYVSAQGLVPPLGGTKPIQDVRARGAGPPAAAGLTRRTAQTPGGPAAHDAVPSLAALAGLERSGQIEALRTAASEGGGFDVLRQAGELGADPVAVAIVAWGHLFGGRPGLSRKRRAHLERACVALDRIKRPGYGIGALLAMMHAVACDLEDQAAGEPVGVAPALGRHPTQPAPETLNYFVARLRSDARSRRRAWRQARREPGAPGSSGAGADG